MRLNGKSLKKVPKNTKKVCFKLSVFLKHICIMEIIVSSIPEKKDENTLKSES